MKNITNYNECVKYALEMKGIADEIFKDTTYSQLPESERQYDRLMAEDTLKLLIALGYKIEKNN